MNKILFNHFSFFIFSLINVLLFINSQENSLIEEAISIREKLLLTKDNDERIHFNNRFLNILEKIILLDTYLTFNYEEKFKIKSLKDAEGKISIIHWNLPIDGENMLYYGFLILYKSEKYRKIYKLNHCIKSSEVLKYGIYGVDCWPGALYYYIKKLSVLRGDTVIYLLLGWDGYSPISDRKVVEFLAIKEDKVIWGVPIIFSQEGILTRLVLEYFEGASVAMYWEDNKGGVVFQEVAPISEEFKDISAYYAPIETFCLLKLKGNFFVIEKNTQVLMPPQKPKKGKKR